jgi:rhamnosyltransferase subunit B
MVFRLPRILMRRWELPLAVLRTELGLTTPGPLAQMEGQYSPALNLALFSSLLAAPQADWPRNTQVCGFPLYDGPPPDADAQNALDAFLAAGEPPIAFALGSSVVAIANDFWSHAIHAARTLGRRAILLTGKTSAQPGSLPPGIAAFEYLPYSLVFPHAAAVVHQAGIGSLAQALASARPQLIVPVAFDQPDNARPAAALQVARTLPFAKVTARTMARELKILLETPVYAQRAAVTGKSVQAEDGAATASDLLSKFAA